VCIIASLFLLIIIIIIIIIFLNAHRYIEPRAKIKVNKIK